MTTPSTSPTSPIELGPEVAANVRIACLNLAGNSATAEDRVRDAGLFHDFIMGTTVNAEPA